MTVVYLETSILFRVVRDLSIQCEVVLADAPNFDFFCAVFGDGLALDQMTPLDLEASSEMRVLVNAITHCISLIDG